MSTLDELGKYIRFQLSELTARNAHHEFEHIARHFSRLRISERIIPATGPVGAGGDAGRDFETYRSYLASTPIAASTFLSRNAGTTLVFACSLMKSIDGKIRTDLKTIFGHAEKVDSVYYFCEANVAIGNRNKLKQFCKEKYHAELIILDGQALAEGLTDIDVFWIAQQFLGVPAEMYPKPLTSSRSYEGLRQQWIIDRTPPASLADFMAVKSGLRRATFRKEHRPDLPSWLSIMESIRASARDYRRRATYEICVAALRGLNDLSSRRDLVIEYFEKLPELTELVDLRDAGVLLSYCSSAAVHGHFDMDGKTLHKYSLTLLKRLDESLRGNVSIGRRCELLQIRGSAEALWFRSGPEAQLDAGGMFSYWKSMLRLVPNAPLFPLEQFADVLTLLAPSFAGDPRFDEITQRTDRLLEKRSSGYVAAEKCRDRAMEFLKQDKLLHAIRQLHNAKVKWFSAETLRASVLSMLVLSESYRRLGLIYAAKQYALGAVFLAHSASDESVKDVIAKAFRQLFNVCYDGGEWFTCATLISLVFATHNEFETDRYDLDTHADLMAVVYHLTVLRLITRRLAPGADDQIAKLESEWPIPDYVRTELGTLLKDCEATWPEDDAAQMRSRIESELWGRPFVDVGRIREVAWRALGIQWRFTFDNDRDTVAVSEELISALQVILAELSITDLVLLPTSVHLDIFLTPRDALTTEEIPGNEVARWKVGLPRSWITTQDRDADASPMIVALACTILGRCTVMSGPDFHSRMTAALKAGLFNKTMVVRPYAELYCAVMDKDSFARDVRERLAPLFVRESFHVREAEELAWPQGDAPGYSRERAEEFIRNRYRRAIKPIRITLPRILRDPAVLARCQALREKGIKDWEIILVMANLVMNYRANLHDVRSLEHAKTVSNELMNTEETESSPTVPVEEFSDENIDRNLMLATMSEAKTWGLHVHRETPDIKAMRQVLEVRFHITRDDVPHDAIFD